MQSKDLAASRYPGDSNGIKSRITENYLAIVKLVDFYFLETFSYLWKYFLSTLVHRSFITAFRCQAHCYIKSALKHNAFSYLKSIIVKWPASAKKSRRFNEEVSL